MGLPYTEVFHSSIASRRTHRTDPMIRRTDSQDAEDPYRDSKEFTSKSCLRTLLTVRKHLQVVKRLVPAHCLAYVRAEVSCKDSYARKIIVRIQEATVRAYFVYSRVFGACAGQYTSSASALTSASASDSESASSPYSSPSWTHRRLRCYVPQLGTFSF